MNVVLLQYYSLPIITAMRFTQYIINYIRFYNFFYLLFIGEH